MLDGEETYRRFTDQDIYWGAYLGTADEILIAGRLPMWRRSIAFAPAQRSAAGSRHGAADRALMFQ